MKKILFVTVFVLLVSAHPGLLPAQNLELDYSTYLGGDDIEYGNAITVDPAGCAYVAGTTNSDDFPTANPYQGDHYSDAAFVTKFSTGGSSLIFSTYLGGSSSYAYGYGIALDSILSVYVTGATGSRSFPTLNPYQSSHAGGNDNVFVTKFSSTGSELIYSTYLGGAGNYEEPYQIVVDSAQRAYVCGNTTSQNFPTVNPYQASYAGGGSPEIIGDAFITKFSSSGSSLLYSTYLGGDNGDRSWDIVLGSGNYLYFAGRSSSDDFPTLNPYQASRAWDIDGIVGKLSSSGSELIYSTYLGGDHHDIARGVALDSAQCAYVTGDTFSDDFPTVNPYQASREGNTYDVFVSKFSTSGSLILYSTYLGGSEDDQGRGIAVGRGDFAYITGDTSSTDFPPVNAYQSSFAGGNNDAFVSKLCCRGRFLLYSTYLGGSNSDGGSRIFVDLQDNVYVIGTTQSTNFPLKNPYQSTPDESWGNVFVTKLGYTPPYLVLENGDYNGDGTDDTAIFRPASGLWAVRGITRLYFGASGDTPVSGDYDGNSTTDFGVYRENTGLWAVRGITRLYFAATDNVPVPGDYNGDGICAAAIFQKNIGLWRINNLTLVYFGASVDIPAPGDYNGDDTTDIALYRGTSGLWALRGISRIYFGQRSDQVAPGDYSGSGTWLPAIFRPASGLWAIRGVTRSYFGSCEDRPVPADYDGAGSDNIAIFRCRLGLWVAKDITRVYYGSESDTPVTR